MNSEFKKFFGFSKNFEFQKISNDYKNTKHYKLSRFGSIIIFTLFGACLVKIALETFKNKNLFLQSLRFKKKILKSI